MSHSCAHVFVAQTPHDFGPSILERAVEDRREDFLRQVLLDSKGAAYSEAPEESVQRRNG